MKEHDIGGGVVGGGGEGRGMDPHEKIPWIRFLSNSTLCASNFIALFPSATMNTNFIFYLIAVKL